MVKVSRQSLNEMMVEQRTQFAALQAGGEVTPAVAALFETLLSMLQMLVLLLLEKKTKKTSQTSDLPSSLTPFDKTAASRKGSKRKGPKPERGKCEKVRLEVEQQTSAVCECSGCGEDLSEVGAGRY